MGYRLLCLIGLAVYNHSGAAYFRDAGAPARRLLWTGQPTEVPDGMVSITSVIEEPTGEQPDQSGQNRPDVTKRNKGLGRLGGARKIELGGGIKKGPAFRQQAERRREGGNDENGFAIGRFGAKGSGLGGIQRQAWARDGNGRGAFGHGAPARRLLWTGEPVEYEEGMVGITSVQEPSEFTAEEEKVRQFMEQRLGRQISNEDLEKLMAMRDLARSSFGPNGIGNLQDMSLKAKQDARAQMEAAGLSKNQINQVKKAVRSGMRGASVKFDAATRSMAEVEHMGESASHTVGTTSNRPTRQAIGTHERLGPPLPKAGKGQPQLTDAEVKYVKDQFQYIMDNDLTQDELREIKQSIRDVYMSHLSESDRDMVENQKPTRPKSGRYGSRPWDARNAAATPRRLSAAALGEPQPVLPDAMVGITSVPAARMTYDPITARDVRYGALPYQASSKSAVFALGRNEVTTTSDIGRFQRQFMALKPRPMRVLDNSVWRHERQSATKLKRQFRFSRRNDVPGGVIIRDTPRRLSMVAPGPSYTGIPSTMGRFGIPELMQAAMPSPQDPATRELGRTGHGGVDFGGIPLGGSEGGSFFARPPSTGRGSGPTGDPGFTGGFGFGKGNGSFFGQRPKPEPIPTGGETEPGTSPAPEQPPTPPPAPTDPAEPEDDPTTPPETNPGEPTEAPGRGRLNLGARFNRFSPLSAR